MKSKSVWSRPVLVKKPVQETMQGVGANNDGIGGEFPVQS